MEKIKAMELIESQYQRSRATYPPFCSPIEGWAVIFREVEELKLEVFNKYRRNDENMRSEAAQVAAMAQQFLIDLC